MEKISTISAKVSLDGTKELYLIIVGIGITEALMHTDDFTRASDFVPYFVLLTGYLLTVFRFSLGMINMLGHVAERVHNHWSKVVSFVALSFLTCGLCFFWMGLHLQTMPMFLITSMLLLMADWSTLFISHRPWAPPRGWGWWMLAKTAAICLWYPRGWYDPYRDTKHYSETLSADARLIKSTHYQWIRSNFWLFVIFAALFAFWQVWIPSRGVPDANLTPAHLKEIGYELVLGLIMISFAFWDFSVNKIYYFGQDQDVIAADTGL